MKILHEELLSSYLFFGWIDPKGKLVLPTIEDKNSPYIILHADLLDGNINDLFKQGYIRFLIEKKTPKQITYFTKNLEKVNLVSFLSGMKEIENLIATNKINPKVFPNPIPLPEDHVFEYEKDTKFHEVSAKSPQELKRKIEAEKIKLTESSIYDYLNRSYAGWASPDGRVFFDWGHNYEGHSGMIGDLGRKVFNDYLNKGNARQKGYTRLVLDVDTLRLNPWFKYIKEIGKDNWIKLVSKIIKNVENEIIKSGKINFPKNISIDISGYSDEAEQEAKQYGIQTPLDSMFLKKYKAKIEQTLNEFFEMERYYLAWGWVNKQNKLIVPSLKMKNSTLVRYNHDSILPKAYWYKDPIEYGFIRWVIQKNRQNELMLYIECNKKLLAKDLEKKIKVIEKYLEKQPDQVFPNKPPFVNWYYVEFYDENLFSFQKIEAATLPELLKKYEKTVKNEPELVSLEEKLPMEKYYLAWGWVDIPNHYKLILPTKQMKESNATFYHVDIIPEKDEINALRNKKVKWSLEKSAEINKLFITVHPKVSKKELMNAINVIEKFLESDEKNDLFPYKSPIINYYLIEYNNVDYTTISATTKQSLFNKIKNFYASSTLDEAFGLEPFYIAWGWITPEGNLLLPTKEMKTMKEYLFTHEDILPFSHYPPNSKNINKVNEAFKKGYIRWHIEKMNPKVLILSLNKDYASPSSLSSGIDKIEKYLQKRPDEIFPEKPETVFEYLVDITGKELDITRSYIQSKSKSELINKFKQMFKLNEYFEMEDWYLAWGWATPQGKLILPTLKMKKNPNVNYIHDNILDISKKQALGMGFIRWFIELGYGNLPKLVLHFLPEAVEYSTIVKTIQNIEKFLSKHPDPLFSDKPSAIFKYEADIVDRYVSIRGESKIEFLRKLKEIYEREEELITEFFGMDGFYLAWGWITPDGRLLLPTEEERDSEQSIVHLLFLQKHYPKYESILEALDDGFVRWHIERGETFPDLWLSFMPHKIKPENLRKGIDKIQAFLKKQPDPIFRKKPEFFDKIQTTFYYYPKKDSEFYKFSSVIQLLNKVKSEKTLSEKFLHTTYLAWGIVTKKGKLIKPTLEQKNSSDFVIHSDIIPKSEGKYFSIDEYVEDGGIRWLIEKDRDGKIGLLIDVSKKIDNQKLLKITKMILDDKPDEVFPEKPLTVDYIIVFREGEEFLAKNYSHLRKMLTSNSE